MKSKIILDLCGGTGAWSKPYKDAGYEVYNITLPKYDILRTEFRHGYRDMIIDNLIMSANDIYGILAAPPCTMFSLARTKAKNPRDLEGAMKIVRACLNIIWFCQYETEKISSKKTVLKFWALENPNGMLKYFLGKPTYEFQPHEFGESYQKKTCLWGWFNEPIKSNKEKMKLPKYGSDKPIEFRFNKELKSITPEGFAKAFFEANR